MTNDLTGDSSLGALARAYGIGGDGHAPIQRDLARALGRAMLDEIKSNDLYADVHALGRTMIEALWSDQRGEAMAALQKKIAAITDPDTQRHAAELLARLGHLHQMAGLLLRDLELEAAPTKSTAESFLDGETSKDSDGKIKKGKVYTNPAEAVAALNRPRIEFTFTAHPTNTNGESGMEAQREIALALDAWKANPADGSGIKTALRGYLNAPLLPELDNHTPGFTVRSETEFMLSYLNHVYQDLDRVYKGYDTALDKLSKKRDKQPYRPETLKLNLGLHSWGSSADKDGNGNVNADTTLYALAAHHQQILNRYKQDFDKVPGLSEDWKKKIAHGQAEATEVMNEITDTKGPLSEDQFDRLSARLKGAVGDLDKQAFVADLEKAYTAAPTPELLSMLRHARVFGFCFATLEYRETAEEFERVVAAIIPEYGALMEPIFALKQQLKQEDKKEKALRQEGHDDEADQVKNTIESLEQQIAVKRRQAEYHRCTIINDALTDDTRRTQLVEALHEAGKGGAGKEYSDKDVAPIAYATKKRLELARDFPQAIQNHVLAECQDTSNLLEMLLLQHATTDASGTRPKLGIIPLFEDSDTLEKSPQILQSALANPHYRHHLDEVAAAQGTSAAQQIQLAHSDNARRNGLPAARGLIYKAHQDLDKAMSDYNREHEGKITLQFYEGGSMSDSYRGGTRAVSASINEFQLHGFTKMTAQGGDLLNYFNLPHSTYRLLMRNITHNAMRLEEGPRPGIKRSFDQRIRDALIATKDAYKSTLFHHPIINRFLEAIGFAQEARAGNIGSRKVSRGNGEVSDEVDVTKVRTIAFSEGFQHAGMNPSWMGVLPLPQLLRAQGILTRPNVLHEYYAGEKKSPVFRDAIDRILFGLTTTDMDYLEKRSGNHELMTRFKKEYGVAFQLCMEAYTGMPVEALLRKNYGKQLADLTPKEEHQILVNEVYSYMTDVFQDQDRYKDVVRAMKQQWLKDDKGLDAPQAAVNFRLRTTLHNATDTIIHGRLPLIDDPTYQTLYRGARGIELPWVQAQSPAMRA